MMITTVMVADGRSTCSHRSGICNFERTGVLLFDRLPMLSCYVKAGWFGGQGFVLTPRTPRSLFLFSTAHAPCALWPVTPRPAASPAGGGNQLIGASSSKITQGPQVNCPRVPASGLARLGAKVTQTSSRSDKAPVSGVTWPFKTFLWI